MKNIELLLLLLFFQGHLSDYVENKLTASERRVLITQWVGEVWEDMSLTMRQTIIRGFQKCGITVAHDGFQDHLINIEGLPDYTSKSVHK